MTTEAILETKTAYCNGCYIPVSEPFFVEKKTYCKACRKALTWKMPFVIRLTCEAPLCLLPSVYRAENGKFYCLLHAKEALGLA